MLDPKLLEFVREINDIFYAATNDCLALSISCNVICYHREKGDLDPEQVIFLSNHIVKLLDDYKGVWENNEI